MQLHALDKMGFSVFAGHAEKRVDYVCIECTGIVRLRGGVYRQKHFYHVQPNEHCRMNGKGMIHLATQLFICNLLPRGSSQIEYRFNDINRIADVAWISEKIVFEIQCAPISAEEILQRNKDYLSLGWQPVWILHDNRYNKSRMTSAEIALRSSPCYFTNINSEGHGIIYDQYETVHQGYRKYKMNQLPIEIQSVIWHRGVQTMRNVLIEGRLFSWPLYFEGDLVSKIVNDTAQEYIEEAFKREKKFISELFKFEKISFRNRCKLVFYKYVVRPYRLWFQLMLEKMCR